MPLFVVAVAMCFLPADDADTSARLFEDRATAEGLTVAGWRGAGGAGLLQRVPAAGELLEVEPGAEAAAGAGEHDLGALFLAEFFGGHFEFGAQLRELHQHHDVTGDVEPQRDFINGIAFQKCVRRVQRRPKADQPHSTQKRT